MPASRASDRGDAGAGLLSSQGATNGDGSGSGLQNLLSFAVQLQAQLGGIHAELKQQRDERLKLLGAIFDVDIPAQSGTVTAAGALTIANTELLGPKSGWYWDVRRVSVSGLNSSTEIVSIYKGSIGTSTEQLGNNFVATITGKAGTFGPGLAGMWLRPNQSINIGGSGLTAGEIVIATYEAVAIKAEYAAAYLL